MSLDCYPRVGAYRDRPQVTDDTRRQTITVVMTENRDEASWQTIRPAVCHLSADRAREFAAELLSLANAVERSELAS